MKYFIILPGTKPVIQICNLNYRLRYIYNIYNRMNAFTYYYSPDDNEAGFVLKKLVLFPIMPSISYSLQW